MQCTYIQVEPRSELMSAVNDMMRGHVSTVPVVDDTGQLVNVFTKFDLIVSKHTGLHSHSIA